MKTKLILITVVVLSFISQSASAAVTLLDQNEWKILMSGFVETDLINDSTRSFTEVIGNNPVVSSAGRTQFSIRNSRLAFTILPPVQDDWKSKGYFEFDLLGYDPGVASSGTTNSESSFYTNPTLRVRHAYLSLDKNDWQILTGQSWTLFGWQPNYVLTTVSVPPAPAVLYQRTPEVMAVKKLALSDSENLQIGASLARPSQRDSEMPNVDAGVRLTSSRWRSGFSSPSSDVNVEPMSLALTGTRRDFVTPKATATPEDLTHHTGYAYAVDLLMPILPAGDDGAAGSLTWTAEFTQGNGYSDAFSGLSGNLAQMPSGTAPAVSSATNLDAGQGGFDADGNFHLVNLQTWNSQLQYHLPGEMHTFLTAGYAQLKSDNMKNLTASAATGKTLYDETGIYFFNIFHDCTKQVRVALEYSQIRTHYIDDTEPIDHRYQASFFFRF